MGVKALSGFPSAWDYHFSRVSEPLWTLVTLKDGSKVAGWFGSNSLASSGERDLYLEQVYRLSEDEPWQPVPGNSGIWIRGDEICYIEFWKDPLEEI